MAAQVTIDEVVIPELTPLQKLAAVKAQVDDFDKEIENAKQIFGITQLEKHRDLRLAEYNSILKEVVDGLTFKEDKFLASIGKKGESYRENGLMLVRMTKITREVRSKDFEKAFPDIAKVIMKIEVGKAEKMVGAAVLEKYCNLKESRSYELYDLEKLASQVGGK